jgi:hypothetical protein
MAVLSDSSPCAGYLPGRGLPRCGGPGKFLLLRTVAAHHGGFETSPARHSRSRVGWLVASASVFICHEVG